MDQLGIDPIKLFADGLALAYHEARNVRHLIRGRYVPASQWQRLVSSLATNRVVAWKQLQSPRQAARLKPSARAAAQLFIARFGKNIDDLVQLFKDPNWTAANEQGGHAWVLISILVSDLGRSIDNSDAALVCEASIKLIHACHNTGPLRKKILELDREVGAMTDMWWLLPEGTK